MDASAFLARLRARLRRVLLLEGLARVVFLAVVAVAGLVAADWLWRLPGWLRLILLGCLAGSLAAAALRRLWRPLRQPLDATSLARLAERRLPALDGRLLSAVEGLDLGDGERGRLAAELQPASIAALVPAPRLPRRLALAGSACGAALAACAVWPALLTEGLPRVLLPLSGAQWTRASALAGRLERPVVAADEPLVVQVERTRGHEAPLRLAWGQSGAPVRERRQLAGLQGPWRQALSLSPGSWRVVASSADAEPLILLGRVVERPSLRSLEATLTPPAYARRQPERLSTLALSALPGSRLAFRAGFAAAGDGRIASGSAAFGGQALPLRVEGGLLAGELTLMRSGDLVLSAADGDGIEVRPPPRFAVTVVEDRRPVVSLTGPAARSMVTPRARLRLRLDAADDLALARLALVARSATAAEGAAATPGPEREVAAFPDVAGQPAAVRTAVLEVGAFARVGEQLLLQARAADANDVTGPGVGESEALALRVVADDELRQELERLARDTLERVQQGRQETARGLAHPEALIAAARSAAQAAERAEALAMRVAEAASWLPPPTAHTWSGPVVKLLAAAQTDLAHPAGDALRAAEARLGEAERLIAAQLSEGDLTRQLEALLARQTALAEESRAFVRDHLTREPDAAGKARQASLAERQSELADRVRDLERRVLAGGPALDQAKETVRAQAPGEALRRAAGDLGSADQRPRAVEGQRAGIATLQKLLEQLRGGDAAGDLGQRAGALAAEQEKLNQEIEEGARPQDLEARQQELERRTRSLAEEAAKKQPQAGKTLEAAAQAQGQAAQAEGQGDRAAAGREGAAAAALLREAQRQLDPRGSAAQDKPKDAARADVVALLRALARAQAKILVDATLLHGRLGDKDPGFGEAREVGGLAQAEEDVGLRLREEGIKELEEKMPIAAVALGRVAGAIDSTVGHLRTPALGRRGVTLIKLVLQELERLVAIADAPPPPGAGGEGGGGKGNGSGDQAPFPPAAQIGLLIAMQDEVAGLTAAGRPIDLGAAQDEVRKLVGMVAQATRPGSRPALLVGRADRAMASAGHRLGQGDRGLVVRHEQQAAAESLRRLLAEAQQGGSSSGGAGRRPPGERPGDQPPPDGDPQGGQPGGQGGGNPGQAGGAPGQAAQGGAAGVRADQQGDLMQLPPERREQLRQARLEHLPARAIQVFQHYLELLEAGR